MERFELYEKLVDEIAKRAILACAENAIVQMKQFRGALLSGDSRLKNLWEEYCVQVQGEESFFFEEYEETILNYARAEVNSIPRFEQIAIMLYSYNEGFDFDDWENQSLNSSNIQQLIPDEEFLAIEVKDRIQSIAVNDETPNVKAYLEGDEEE